MRRGNKPTLYELMSTGTLRSDPTPVTQEAGPRTLRVPVGFLYIGIAVLVVLLMGSYWFGFLRGDSVARADWDRDRADSLAVDRQMRAVLEVDEPGGAMRDQPPTQQVGTIPAVLEEPVQARPSVPAALVTVAPAPVAIEPLNPRRLRYPR